MCESPVSRERMVTLSNLAGVESKWDSERWGDESGGVGSQARQGWWQGRAFGIYPKRKSHKLTPMLHERCSCKCPLSYLLPSDSVN